MARPIVAFCIPNRTIGGAESVFIKTLEKRLSHGDFKIVLIIHPPHLQEPFYIHGFNRNKVAIRVLYPMKTQLKNCINRRYFFRCLIFAKLFSANIKNILILFIITDMSLKTATY